MSAYSNPTALRIGLSGTLEGREYTVLGRVVLGVVVDGETYYWNEFYLGTTDGDVVTLVFEEMESGPTWKLFRQFMPANPMSVADARAKRVGDVVNWGGRTARVTLVDASKVYHIEGDAPAGTELGEVAGYFNAESGGRMSVVTWKGEKVDFYEGRDLPRGFVEQAFGLPAPRWPSVQTNLLSGKSFSGGVDSGWIGGGLAIAAIALIFWLNAGGCSRDETAPEPPLKRQASANPLLVGAAAQFMGHNYRIADRALVEAAAVGGRYDRREYELIDEAGAHALLVNGLGGDVREWHLFCLENPPAGFGPLEAAAIRRGFIGQVAGHQTQVVQLSQISCRERSRPEAVLIWPAAPQYGLVAHNKDEWLMARWTEARLWLYVGTILDEARVTAAFGGK